MGKQSRPLSHSELLGLTADDHPQYFLLAGRSGGQTAIGGTGAGGSLVLRATSHATAGTIQLQPSSTISAVNINASGKVGIRTWPNYALDVLADSDDIYAASVAQNRQTMLVQLQNLAATSGTNRTGLDFVLYTDSAARTAVRLNAGFSTITDASRTSDLYIILADNGTLAQQARLYGNRGLGLSQNLALGGSLPSIYNDTGSEYAFYVSRTFTDNTASSIKFASYTESTLTVSSGATLSVRGSYTAAQMGSASTASITGGGSCHGIIAASYNRSNYTLPTAAAGVFRIGTFNGGPDTTGTITTAYGLQVEGYKTPSSTITTAYGLHISSISATTAYDIYASTTTARNYLAGTTGIGFTSPAAKLSVNGGCHIGGTTDPGDKNLLVDGTLVVSGAPGNALGTSGASTSYLRLGGSAPATNYGIEAQWTIQPAAGTSGYGFYLSPIFNEAASGTHPLFAGLRILPVINNGAANVTAAAGLYLDSFTARPTTTTASTLYIANAPSGGTNNYALFVDDGFSRFDGGVAIGSTTNPGDSNLRVGGTAQITGGFGCNGASPQTAYASGGALAGYGAGANGLDTAANMQALYNLVVAIRAALVANGIMS